MAARERLALLEARGLVGRACLCTLDRLGVHSPNGCVCVEVGSGTLEVAGRCGEIGPWLRINFHSAPSAPPGAGLERRLIHQPPWNLVPGVPGCADHVINHANGHIICEERWSHMVEGWGSWHQWGSVTLGWCGLTLVGQETPRSLRGKQRMWKCLAAQQTGHRSPKAVSNQRAGRPFVLYTCLLHP